MSHQKTTKKCAKQPLLGLLLFSMSLAGCSGGGHVTPQASALSLSQPTGAQIRSAQSLGGYSPDCNYAIVAGKPNASMLLETNSTVTGNIALAGTKSTLTLDSGATVIGSALVQPAVPRTPGNPAVPGTTITNGGTISDGVITDTGGQAALQFADATNASATDAALTATVAVPGGAINVPRKQTVTITGTAGINVLDVSEIEMDADSTLTLNAPAGSTFIVNDAGELHHQKSSTVNVAGGLSAAGVVFNFIGPPGDADAIHLEAGSVFNGSILAPIGSTLSLRPAPSSMATSLPMAITFTCSVALRLSDSHVHRPLPPPLLGIVSTFAGVAGVIGSADGQGPSASFTYPVGLADQRSGNNLCDRCGNQLAPKNYSGCHRHDDRLGL